MGFIKTITKQTEKIFKMKKDREKWKIRTKKVKRDIEKEDHLLALFTPSPFSVSSYMDKLTIFLYLYRMRIYENKTNLPNNRNNMDVNMHMKTFYIFCLLEMEVNLKYSIPTLSTGN